MFLSQIRTFNKPINQHSTLNQIQSALNCLLTTITNFEPLNVCLYANIHNYWYAWDFSNFQHLNLTMMTWNVVRFFFRWFSGKNIICLLSVYLLVGCQISAQVRKGFLSENVSVFVCFQFKVCLFISFHRLMISCNVLFFIIEHLYLVLHCIDKQEPIYTV